MEILEKGWGGQRTWSLLYFYEYAAAMCSFPGSCFSTFPRVKLKAKMWKNTGVCSQGWETITSLFSTNSPFHSKSEKNIRNKGNVLGIRDTVGLLIEKKLRASFYHKM